jgi:ATPase subunit of ABC transporter with duplicated ATPase domains
VTATGTAATPAVPADPATGGGADPTTGGGADPGTALLEVRGLRAGYGAANVLRGIDLRVATGQIVVVLGPTERARPP